MVLYFYCYPFQYDAYKIVSIHVYLIPLRKLYKQNGHHSVNSVSKINVLSI